MKKIIFIVILIFCLIFGFRYLYNKNVKKTSNNDVNNTNEKVIIQKGLLNVEHNGVPDKTGDPNDN